MRRESIYGIALICFLVAGCSTTDKTPAGTTLEDAQSDGLIMSGFLSDYSNLTPSTVPETQGAYTYRNRAKPLSIYKMVILDKTKVHLREGAAGVKQDPQKLRELAKFFDAKLQQNLGDSFPLVHAPGFGVMRIRAAIVEASPSMPMSKGIDAPAVVGVAGIELEVLDSTTGEQLAAAVDTRKGNWYKLRNALKEDDAFAKDLLSNWAVLLRNGLDSARGLHRGSDVQGSGKLFFN